MHTGWRDISGALLIAGTVATAAFAQVTTLPPSTPAGSGAQTTVSEPKTSGGYNATFTGCVERAEQLPAATPATQNVDNDSQSFLLTHALRGAAGTTQPVGTSGADSTSAKGTTYKLEGAAATLSPHVGKKVEVTGFVTLAMAQPTVTDGPVASLSASPRVRVDNIKTIAETCAR